MIYFGTIVYIYTPPFHNEWVCWLLCTINIFLFDYIFLLINKINIAYKMLLDSSRCVFSKYQLFIIFTIIQLKKFIVKIMDWYAWNSKLTQVVYIILKHSCVPCWRIMIVACSWMNFLVNFYSKIETDWPFFSFMSSFSIKYNNISNHNSVCVRHVSFLGSCVGSFD
jgi:hypothetical protein